MSLVLALSNRIHDSFLHISPSLFMKITNNSSPILQLYNDGAAFSFWCILDSTLYSNQALLNSKVATSFGIKEGKSWSISISAFNYKIVDKILISIPDVSNDWDFFHENFELLQSVILDQIRLVKRGLKIPIYTDIRNSPVFMIIEQLCGYKSDFAYGLLDQDTELIVMNPTENTNISTSYDASKGYISEFLIAPSSSFKFFANSVNGLPKICSYMNHSFVVETDDSLPSGVLLAPDIILTSIFGVIPKSKIKLSQHSAFKLNQNQFTGQYNFTVDGLACRFDSTSCTEETIISCDNGLVVRTNDIKDLKIIQVQAPKPQQLNSLAKLFSSDSSRLILFHGPPGWGKSNIAQEAVNQLNFNPNFRFRIQYVDLLTEKVINDRFIDSDILLLDHIDEYLYLDHENEDSVSRKLLKLHHNILDFLSACNQHKICIIVRSSKDFLKLFKNAPLPIDFIFGLDHYGSDWFFSPTSAPWNNVYERTSVKSMIERHILNPIKFSNIFRANNMKLHSGILLTGPSGSGKTFIAKSFIDHFKIPSITIRGPEILDKYVGASERAVRELFSRARSIRPCIVFFDEIDSVIPRRGSNQSGVTDRIVNQFLTELDGTEDRSGIFVLATSSKPEIIDKAILRPGRIDTIIELLNPSIEDTEKFFLTCGAESSSFKPLIDFLNSRSEVKISWADLFLIDWRNPAFKLNDFISSLSIVKSTPSSKNSTFKNQKLSLA